MIKNIIFDFGQVLVRFIPYDMTKAYIKDEKDIELAKDVIFDRLYWDRLDAGTIEDEEVVRLIKDRLPERLWADIEKVYYGWIYNIPEIEGMKEIVSRLKSEGINLCILSNISKYFVAHHEEIEVLKLFDKKVFSSVCGLAKPDEKIFEYTLKKYNFLAGETLFVDDNRYNIRGAENIGINGYLFDGNVKKFDEYLKTLGL